MKFLFPVMFLTLFLSACQTGAGGFKTSLISSSYGYQEVTAPEPARLGDTSQRFEVRAGDCGSDGGWSDCSHDRERAELSGTAYSGDGHWYGWSMYIPDDYQRAYPVKVALGQFHQKGSKKPPFMFQNSFGGLWFDDQLTKNHDTALTKIIEKDNMRGKWHDFVVNARWTTGKDGYIKVWVDGELKVDRLGATKMAGGSVYFKYGIYRTHVSRYLKQKGTEIPTQIVYYDEVRHGGSREEVDVRVIEKTVIKNP